MEQLVMVLAVASPWNLIVDVPEVAEVLVLAMVRLLPPVFNPSIRRLSAPLISMSGAALLPLMVRAAPPEGEMDMDAQVPAFKLVVPASVVTSAVMLITIASPALWLPAVFSAAKAPLAFVNEV
jgi:hypothetical protein